MEGAGASLRARLRLWWCLFMHGGRSSLAFGMPTAREDDQQIFQVRCRLCRHVHYITTPIGWTSPWRQDARVVHVDRNNPVHKHEGAWWFWDMAHKARQGPYASEAEAYNEYLSFFATSADKQQAGTTGR